MMEWLRRMMRREASHPEMGRLPEDRSDLVAERARQRTRLSRADAVLRQVMSHADDVILPYRGPERRARRR